MPEKKMASPEKEITMRDLYPNLTDEEFAEAEKNFNRYLEIVIRIYERRLGRPVLTGLDLDSPIDPTGPSRRTIQQHQDILEMRRKKFDSPARSGPRNDSLPLAAKGYYTEKPRHYLGFSGLGGKTCRRRTIL
jgi:hypothetical protein